jgi:predicted CopG family antitoxin
MQATSDDMSRMSVSDVMERLRSALRDLTSIATTGDPKIDAEVLEAEQALRRAMKGIKATLHTAD